MKTALFIIGGILLLSLLFSKDGRALLMNTLESIFKLITLPFTLLLGVANYLSDYIPEKPSGRPEAFEMLCTVVGLGTVVVNIIILCWSLGSAIPNLSTYAVVAIAWVVCLLEVLSGVLLVEARRRRQILFMLLFLIMLLAFAASETILAIVRTSLVTDSVYVQIAIGVISFVIPLVCALSLASLPKVLQYTLGYTHRSFYLATYGICYGVGTFGGKLLQETQKTTLDAYKTLTYTFERIEISVRKTIDKISSEEKDSDDKPEDDKLSSKNDSFLLLLLAIGISIGCLGCSLKSLETRPKGREIYVFLDTSASFQYCGDSVNKTKQIISNMVCGDTLTVHEIRNLGFVPATLVMRGQMPCNENQFNLNPKQTLQEKERLAGILEKKVSCRKENKSRGTHIVSAILYVASLIHGTKTPPERRLIIFLTDLGNTEKEETIDPSVLKMKLPKGKYFVLDFLCIDGARSASCTYKRKVYWTQWFKARGIEHIVILLPEQSDVNKIVTEKKQTTFL